MQQTIDDIFLHKIYAKLIECAMNNETINSATLAESIGLPKGNNSRIQTIMNNYLSLITNFEHSHRRPMLTSMIVQKSSKPTKAWLKSYFSLYENLNAEDVELRAKDFLRADAAKDCKDLLEREQKRVVEYWTIPQLLQTP